MNSNSAPLPPLISVLIPVYNVAPYIERSLASLLTQTMRDIRIVVVNDCSTDETLEIVERIAAADRRIQILNTPRNAGIVGGLNYGLPYCSGPFIARMDGDDVATPDRLQRQLSYLEQHDDIALVGCEMSSIDVNDNPIELMGSARVPTTQAAIAKTLRLGAPCAHIWLARRDVYDTLRGYRDLAPCEDYDFLLRAVTAGFKISNLKEQLMRIRIRPGSTADTSALKQRKTHHYVVKLYEERLSAGTDSFSPQNLERFVRAGKFESAMHARAVRLMKRAFKARSRAAKLLFLLLSAGSSAWQAKHFWDRARQKWILRIMATFET